MSDDRTIIDVFEEVLGVAFDLRWTKEISIDVPVARRLARAVKPYMRAFAYRKKILARCDLIFPTPMVISPGASNGADVTVKDTKRFAATGGWGYFNFNHHEPKALTATVKAKSECAFCNIASAKRDEVWTQFYRVLDEVPAPQGGKGR